MKGKIPYKQRHYVIYCLMCPGCSRNNIGKKSCLLLRMKENDTRETEPMFKHLSECELFKESCSYYALASVYNNSNEGMLMMAHIHNFVLCNDELLDINYN